MTMIEKWLKFLDIGGHAGAPLTDLSKAFDCMDHELLPNYMLTDLTLMH